MQLQNPQKQASNQDATNVSFPFSDLHFFVRHFRASRLPACIGQCHGLRELDLQKCSPLEQLPASIAQLSQLEVITLMDCTNLRELPDAITKLTTLQTLNLSGCVSLRQLPSAIGNLHNLRMLNLSGCRGLRLPDLSRCSQLTSFNNNMPGRTATKKDDFWDHLKFSMQTLSPAEGCRAVYNLLSLMCSTFFIINFLKSLPAYLLSPVISLYHLLRTLLVPWQLQRNLVRVPLNYLPPKLRGEKPHALLDPAKVQSSIVALSWISILLATASFVGFCTAPGGPDEAGIMRVYSSPPSPIPAQAPALAPAPAAAPAPTAPAPASPPPLESPYAVNQPALRLYSICNIITFFLSFATTLFCVTENMPDSDPPTAHEVFVTLSFASLLFVLSIIAGAITFSAGVFTVFPHTMLSDVIIPTVVAGSALLVVLIRHVIHLVYLLLNANKWRRFLGGNIQVTFPSGDFPAKEKVE